MLYPLAALVALLLYQGTNAGLYYLIGTGVWFWAFGEGEVCAVRFFLFGSLLLSMMMEG